MLSDAIKLFEILLRLFDKDVEVGQGFFRAHIEPLYANLTLVYGDYNDAYRELLASYAGLCGPSEFGKLQEILTERKRALEPLRIQIISSADRIEKTRTYEKLTEEQKQAVKAFCQEVSSFFQISPVDDFLSGFGRSFYYGLIWGKVNRLVSPEHQFHCEGDWENIPNDANERLKEKARRLIEEDLPRRWITLSDAYADLRSQLL